MIRVAVIYLPSERWLGGVQYLSNLFLAVHAQKNRIIQFVIFTGRKVKSEQLSVLSPNIQVEKTSYFDHSDGLRGFLWKTYIHLIKMLWNVDYFDFLLKAHHISVCSHSWRYNRKGFYKSVNWIPDFQHMHLPQYFSDKELAYRNSKYMETIQSSDCVIVNSRSVFNDLKRFAPQYTDKVRILPFVCPVNAGVYSSAKTSSVFERIKIPRKYFFVPNQFWQHKNHGVVFSAVGLLKRKGIRVTVVCTGNTVDFRNENYFQTIRDSIQKLGIEKNIFVLGVIPHDDVLVLMRHSVSMINPSLFEGWSTSVEEAKSLGKNSILSDIPVHREQSPQEAQYFDPHDPSQLADIMEKTWNRRSGGPDYDLEKKARVQVMKRIMAFGRGYQAIIADLVTVHSQVPNAEL